jgi:disulfide bond formation protein DsbB
MFGFYVRIALIILGFAAAAILFAFAFSVAAVVVLVLLLVGLLFGRKPGTKVWVWRSGSTSAAPQPLTIEHDPNDLPPKS